VPTSSNRRSSNSLRRSLIAGHRSIRGSRSRGRWKVSDPKRTATRAADLGRHSRFAGRVRRPGGTQPAPCHRDISEAFPTVATAPSMAMSNGFQSSREPDRPPPPAPSPANRGASIPGWTARVHGGFDVDMAQPQPTDYDIRV
jgi:hypothetical protein